MLAERKLNIRKHLLGVIKGLAQVAQRECEVTILGDNSKPDWIQPWAACSSWPCLSRRVGLDNL